MTLQHVECHSLFVDYRRIVDEIATPVYLGASFALNKPIVPPYNQRFIAVWDTGATSTCISENIAMQFSFRLSGQANIRSVTGTSKCNTYLLALHPFGERIIIPELEVSGCIENIGCDILIGMDVISMGDFAICNKNLSTTFSFRIPSVGSINFVSEGTPVNQAAPSDTVV
jgi:hypothetical protein